MVEHLVWAFELSTGQAQAACQFPEAQREQLKAFLYHNRPTPREFQNPVLAAGLPPLRHASLPEAKAALRVEVERYDKRLGGLNADGQDTGGDTVNHWIRALAAMQQVLAEFARREIIIKDLSRGLVDFPALIGGREVFLCWESDEDDIEFWHDLETGYGGREKLE